MKGPPEYKRHLDTELAYVGFSSIAHGFWRTAEKLRHDAIEQTAGQTWPTHTAVHSAICLYQAAVDCFINEEITLRGALGGNPPHCGYKIQGMTLCKDKLNGFFALFDLAGQHDREIQRRVLLLAGLRNRLSHHWPIPREYRDYPVQVIDALKDANIELVNTSWAAQCSDVRVAKWAAEIVHAFVKQWWQIARRADELDRALWDYGPETKFPSPKPSSS